MSRKLVREFQHLEPVAVAQNYWEVNISSTLDYFFGY